jgi:hypothetical protein
VNYWALKKNHAQSRQKARFLEAVEIEIHIPLAGVMCRGGWLPRARSMSQPRGIYEHEVSQIIQALTALDKNAIASSHSHYQQTMFLSK